MTLTNKERAALSAYWQMPIRVRNGNVEAKKGECWGILTSIEDGIKNARIILDKAKQANARR